MYQGLALLAGWAIFRGIQVAYELGKQDGSTARPTPLFTPPPPPLPVEKLRLPVLNGRVPSAKAYSGARELFSEEYVSFTRIDTFAKCPRKFQLAYLNGFRQEETDQSKSARGGSAFASKMDTVFKRYIGRKLHDVAMDPAVQEDPRLQKVVQAEHPDCVVLGTEIELEFVMDQWKFLGYIDLALERPNGDASLLDAKTGYANPRFQPDPIQMDIYSLPGLLLQADRPVHLCFSMVDRGENRNWTNGPANRAEVFERVKMRIAEVEAAQEMEANRGGLCDYCHVRQVCEDNTTGSIYRKFVKSNPGQSPPSHRKSAIRDEDIPY